MVQPMLSVIVPVYNSDNYLKECIESILAQTYSDYELILVDDGSTDTSGKICDEYASKYEFVTVIHKENGGIANTRKTGYNNSCGRYISYIDSDDTIEPDTFKYMLDKAVKHDADAVICNIMLDIGKKRTVRSNIVKSGFYDKERLEKEFYPHMLFGGLNGMPGVIPSLCNKIIKREVLEQALMATDDSVYFGEDALCTYPCLLDANRVYVCNKAFYHYRMVETSITHVYDSELINKFILLVNLLSKAFEKRKFDGRKQLDCYTVRFSIDIVRSELLYNKALSLKERIEVVNKYLEHPVISRAFETISVLEFQDNLRIKLKLVKKRKLYFLFLLLYIKNAFIA